jgi:AraC family transcriptional regulator
MNQRIEVLTQKKLIGLRMRMSFANNKTADLWRSFMPRRKEIQNSAGTDLFSVQFYAPQFFDHFDPTREFDKWAAMEVTDFTNVPEGMETFILPEGTYAVFLYKGAASAGAEAFQYILGTWLPSSGYCLDERPHFEVLGKNYKNEDPDSEEEIWIPIKTK